MEIHTIRRPGHWQTFRERYCYSPWATLLTFVVGAVVCAVLFFLFRWGVWNAEWAADPAACAKADGACWGFVTEKWRLILSDAIRMKNNGVRASPWRFSWG